MAEQQQDEQLIDELVAIERQIAAAEARRAVVMARFVAVRRAEPVVSGVAARKAKLLAGQFAVDEIAAAACWSRGRVEAELSQVRLLQDSLPRLFDRWVAGDIDRYRISKLAEAALRLMDPDSLALLDEQAARVAPTKTATQLGGWCNRFVARTEPGETAARHTRANSERRVLTRTECDGMGSLWALCNAVDAAAIDSVLTSRARRCGAGDPRSMDQRRADILVDLLLGNAGQQATTGGAAVAITVPLQSLMGITETPGELLDRSSSVPASLARQIAARPGTLFYRVLTDPVGRVLDVTQLGRFPSHLLGFAVDIRDGTCRWVTCTSRASGCDADHTPEWPRGRTLAADLIDECRHHHLGSTHGGFRRRQVEPGVVEWTTPTGHRYRVEVEPVPVETWWPPEPETPCPCDDCDAPLLCESDVLTMLPAGQALHHLTPGDLQHLADTA